MKGSVVTGGKKKSILSYCSSKIKLFLRTEVCEIQNGWEYNKAVPNFFKKGERTKKHLTALQLIS